MSKKPDKAELAIAHAFEALEPYEVLRIVEHGKAWGIMETNGPWSGSSDRDHIFG